MTKTKIKELLAESLGLSVEEIDEESLISENLGLSTTSLADLMETLKKEHGIEIPISELKEVETAGDLITLIEENSQE
jgi:acyl carrier protein